MATRTVRKEKQANELKGRYRSSCLSNINLIKEGIAHGFRVFVDRDIGIAVQDTISMQADEDCETTDSLVLHGLNLCYKDLSESFSKTMQTFGKKYPILEDRAKSPQGKSPTSTT